MRKTKNSITIFRCTAEMMSFDRMMVAENERWEREQDFEIALQIENEQPMIVELEFIDSAVVEEWDAYDGR